MKRIVYIFAGLLMILPELSWGQTSTNNPCNIGSQPGSEWPVDGVCYAFNKPTSYSALFNPGTCNADPFDDGWAWFVGTGGNMTINYFPPAGMDAILHVFEAFSACAVNEVGCHDGAAAGGTCTVTLTPSIQGQIYFVRIQRDNSNSAMNGGCLQVSSTTAPSAPDYTHPTVGIQSEFVGSCLEATCSGLYTDDGGMSGNYSNNVNSIYRVFCPDSPGNCVTMTFEYLDIENSATCAFDYLTVGNGPTQNSPVFTTAPALASGRICGVPAVPFSYTSTHASGCLTLRFTSDFTVNAPGWAANITCTPCAGGPSGTDNSDCAFGTTICSNASVPGNSTGPGIVAEGCGGASCPAGGENHTNWYAFQINASGTVEMDIVPTVGTDDYDFAIYGPNVGCGNLGTPIRCSDAGTTGNTGMATGNIDLTENVTGNGYVAPLNGTAGDVYILVVDEWTPTGSGYTINWGGTATLDCTVLPLELISFEGEYIPNEQVVDLKWVTEGEIDTDYYIVQRSTDGDNFEKIMALDANGDPTVQNNYIAIDNQPPAGTVYYRLEMVDEDGIRKYSKVISVQVDDMQSDLIVFPNPSNDWLDVQFTCDQGQAVRISVYDQSGRLLLEENNNCENGFNESQLDVSSLRSGTYILQIEMNEIVEQRLVQVTK